MPNPNNTVSTTEPPFIFQGNRDELSNVHLTAIQGAIPSDLFGYVYLMTQCGTVNSGGYPYPEGNQEYGSPVLNGNGMVYLFDLSAAGQVVVKSVMVKTPSYYADLASRINGPSRQDFEHLFFENHGISRMSFFLGAVNYANTALIPVNFSADNGVSLLATYDTGRPVKIDPNTLEFVTPIGKNSEWMEGVPPFLQGPFPMFETTAHPSWDANEKVLYGVNFSKSAETELSRTFLYELLQKDKKAVRKELLRIARAFKKHEDKDKAIKEIMDFIERAKDRPGRKPRVKKKKKGFLHKILKKLGTLLKFIEHFIEDKIAAETTTIDEVLLIRFNGTGALQKWKLVDETGKTLIVNQCMHQTSISENYIILMDSSFKFAFDLLINNPIPGEPEIDELIRILSSKTILPSTQVWIVKKSDLGSGDTVVARAVKGQPIPGLSNAPYGGVPMECVHFSTDYDDTNDQITIYTAHNNATCLAEWIRTYDKQYFTGANYTAADIGNYAAGQMALSSVGKYVIDGTTATFVPGQNKIIKEEGTLPPINQLDNQPLKNVGPNTWGIGLYAYRGMISPTEAGSKIKQLYFVNFGTRPELLTEYIEALYSEVPNRKLTEKEILAYTKCGIPSSIVSINTTDFKIDDHYEFDWSVNPISIQFIPMKTPTPGIAPEQDGYIWVTAKQLVGEGDSMTYQSQIWLFKGWEVGTGPVCVMAADDFNFCASLHVTWLESKVSPFTTGYNINIQEDFTETIENSFLEPIDGKKVTAFFNDYVYPNFDK